MARCLYLFVPQLKSEVDKFRYQPCGSDLRPDERIDGWAFSKGLFRHIAMLDYGLEIFPPRN
jgi:hypothetical protein